MKDTALEAATAAASAASGVAVKGQALATAGGLFAFATNWSVNDIAAIGGLLVAVAGFVVTWYYRRAEFKLKERLLRRPADAEGPSA